MPLTPYRTWNAGEVVTDAMMNQQIRDNGNILKNFERGGTVFVAAGITAAADILIWQAPEACSILSIKGQRIGGTTATINARKNGALGHLAADLSLAPASTWVQSTAIINPNYAVGDSLEMRITGVTGNPTQIAIIIGFTY